MTAFFALLRDTRAAQRGSGQLGRGAKTSGISELTEFAEGIRRDAVAIWAAFDLSWSQGQVAGQANRLKLHIRQMYGRAKLDLLHRRLLDQPATHSL